MFLLLLVKKLTEASLLADPFTIDAYSVRISLRGVVRLTLVLHSFVVTVLVLHGVLKVSIFQRWWSLTACWPCKNVGNGTMNSDVSEPNTCRITQTQVHSHRRPGERFITLNINTHKFIFHLYLYQYNCCSKMVDSYEHRLCSTSSVFSQDISVGWVKYRTFIFALRHVKSLHIKIKTSTRCPVSLPVCDNTMSTLSHRKRQTRWENAIVSGPGVAPLSRESVFEFFYLIRFLRVLLHLGNSQICNQITTEVSEVLPKSTSCKCVFPEITIMCTHILWSSESHSLSVTVSQHKCLLLSTDLIIV